MVDLIIMERETGMTNIIKKFEGWLGYMTIYGPNFWVAKKCLTLQGLVQKMFPKIFPNSPYNRG
jgi:hypothetical protein